MSVTITISNDLAKELQAQKKWPEDTYEDVLWDLLESTIELSEETKEHIKQAELDFKEGRCKSMEQVKKELCLE